VKIKTRKEKRPTQMMEKCRVVGKILLIKFNNDKKDILNKKKTGD
jgi:hypothetical protein